MVLPARQSPRTARAFKLSRQVDGASFASHPKGSSTLPDPLTGDVGGVPRRSAILTSYNIEDERRHSLFQFGVRVFALVALRIEWSEIQREKVN